MEVAPSRDVGTHTEDAQDKAKANSKAELGPSSSRHLGTFLSSLGIGTASVSLEAEASAVEALCWGRAALAAFTRPHTRDEKRLSERARPAERLVVVINLLD